MIEALFKNRYNLFFLLVFLGNTFCIDEMELAENDYNVRYTSIPSGEPMRRKPNINVAKSFA